MDDVTALRTSNAGMRLIAQQILLNRGDTDRLLHFIQTSYTPAALEQITASQRLEILQATLAQTGKLKVMQVLATDKLHVVVLMQTQQGDQLWMHDIRVEEDYPHLIIEFQQTPLDN